jgi:hypothetical protein
LRSCQFLDESVWDLREVPVYVVAELLKKAPKEFGSKIVMKTREHSYVPPDRGMKKPACLLLLR